MILGVNGIRLVGKRGGVGRYVEYMLRSWAEMDHPFAEIRVYSPARPDPPVEFSPKIRSVIAPAPAGSLALWEQWTLPRLHGTAGPLCCPSYVAPLLSRAPILLIHHGSYEACPEAFPWRTRAKAYRLYKASARKARQVVTVSESSKRDILRFYGIPESKLRVLPEGVDPARFHPIRDEAALADFRRSVFGQDAPFILYVGNSNPRRNIPKLLEAYARLVERGRTDARFLFIGSAMGGIPVEPVVRRLGLQDRVTLLGHAPHGQIALAYNAASLFIYPSSYEGFGIPVLESMACGTPTIALRNTAFVEFADGVAHLAADAEPETLFAAMDLVLHDEPLRERMRAAGPERAKQYEWRDIARKTMALLEEIAAQPPLR